MKRILFTMILAGVMLAPGQTTGQMLFMQGCDAFELVEDLGADAEGVTRWVVRSLKDERELTYVFDTIGLVPRPTEDPTKFSGKGYVAWKIEGTGIEGTNLTELEGTIDASFNFTGFAEGQTFRGTVYKSGGFSATVGGNLVTGLVYEAATIVACKAGFGSKVR
ncbi:MAG: hypothetical protein OES47_04265 [Acidobacteriota bacterium]|nr:hypothetical protein [Acidobacteriota bacterium]